jgi:hypothetical protein
MSPGLAPGVTFLVLFLPALFARAWAWGSEGHSIVAEIAQHRLTPASTRAVADLLGTNVSLASIASWADDTRSEHPETTNWHFVDIPLAASNYEEARDCPANPERGDCIVKELERAKRQIRCAPTTNERGVALRLAVHFVGDIHQPLHTVGDGRGGNQFQVHGAIRGATCRSHCEMAPDITNLHALWDTGLIRRTVWDWGAYVRKLEDGRLKSDDARPSATAGGPRDWALQTHEVAQEIWNDRVIGPDGAIDDRYYERVLPLLDQQLALAGVRLARFLNEALELHDCPAP